MVSPRPPRITEPKKSIVDSNADVVPKPKSTSSLAKSTVTGFLFLLSFFHHGIMDLYLLYHRPGLLFYYILG